MENGEIPDDLNKVEIATDGNQGRPLEDDFPRFPMLVSPSISGNWRDI